MLELEENKRFLNNLKSKLENINESMKINLLKEQLEELKKQRFVLNREHQNQLNDKTQQINDLKDKIEDKIKSKIGKNNAR